MKYLEHERDFLVIIFLFFLQNKMCEINFFFTFFLHNIHSSFPLCILFSPSLRPHLRNSQAQKKKIEIKIYEWNELLYICKFARTLLFSCKISLFKNNEYYIQIKIIIFLSVRVLLEYLEKKKNYLKILACEKRNWSKPSLNYSNHMHSHSLSRFLIFVSLITFHPFDEIHPPNYLFLWDKYIVKLLNYS